MKSFRQKISFRASAHDVYEALMDSKRHAKFTGSRAVISRKVGGTFSVYDGYAVGHHRELIPDKKIVQTWRAADWPEGIFSEVIFQIIATKSGCTLSFSQKGIPKGNFSSIKQGWIEFYWNPMKELLNNR